MKGGLCLSAYQASHLFIISDNTKLRNLKFLHSKYNCAAHSTLMMLLPHPISHPSLTKDMTGREDGYRATAIRSLCKITDITMLTAIERYLKQALVDRNPAVSSAALVSTLHLGTDNS